jgi:hypothetical protein
VPGAAAPNFSLRRQCIFGVAPARRGLFGGGGGGAEHFQRLAEILIYREYG